MARLTQQSHRLPHSYAAWQTYSSTRPLHLRQCRLHLGEPKCHRQRAVPLAGGGQLGTGLLPLPRLGIEPAKAVVAVGLERAHAELFGRKSSQGPVHRMSRHFVLDFSHVRLLH
jgi:hypothetical protein